MNTMFPDSARSGAVRAGMTAWRRALAVMLIALLSPIPALFAFWADASGDWLPDVWVDPASGHVFTLSELNAFSDDIDGDGLSNAQEMAIGTNPFSPDTDGDGISDLLDPLPLSASNLSPANGIVWGPIALDDADGDGTPNFLDEFPYGLSDIQVGSPDTDGDGIPDIIDPAPWDYSNWSPVNGLQWMGDALADADGDGVPNFHDWYPYDSSLWDPLQDPDGDGFVKARDPHPADPYNPSPVNGLNWGPDVYGDADGDGIPNFYDAYPYDSGNGVVPTEPDSDGDGIPDSSDPSPWDYYNYSAANGVSWQWDARGDADNDGISNFYDQFPYDYYNGNVPVFDQDGDGIPDAEDPAPSDPTNLSPINGGLWHTAALADADGDGNPNFTDPWPYDPTNGNLPPEWNSPTADTDGDGIPNAQDPALADPLNFSIYNGTAWHGAAVGDVDNDGIPNFRDEHPYDYDGGSYAGPDADGDGIPDVSDPYPNDPNNGNGDADGDGIPDSQDPAQADPNNLSPFNGYEWFGDVRGDADGDGILNFWDFEPYGPTPVDTDGDGLLDSIDPAPADSYNYSEYNKTNWSADALGDADGDGIPNFFDTWPYDSLNGTGDADMDGIPDAADPVPTDSFNYSPYNQWSWSGVSALGDADNDGILNYFDTYPDDPYNGLPPGQDADGDGIPNEQDPDPWKADNMSPYNGMNWWQSVFGDVDGDGTYNYWDYSPFADDRDGDGIRDDLDPAPDDPTNTSWVNGRAWYAEALNDNDLDTQVNFSDPTPDGGMPYEPYLGEVPSVSASPLVLLNDGYDELGEPPAPGVTPDRDMADEQLAIKAGPRAGKMAIGKLTALNLSLPAEYVNAGGSVTITQSDGADSVRIHAVQMAGAEGVAWQPVALGSAFVPPSDETWTYWIEGVTEGDVSLNFHFPQKTYGGVDSEHPQGVMADSVDEQIDLMVCSAHLSVDRNRDGVISPGSYADTTFPDRPFRFWINDDSDSYEGAGFTLLGGGVETVGGDLDKGELMKPDQPDYAALGPSGRREIMCKRDLEDFAMIRLSGSIMRQVRQRKLRLGIKVTGIDGPCPLINMFRCSSQIQSTRDHVTDDSKAAAMLNVPVTLQPGSGQSDKYVGLTEEEQVIRKHYDQSGSTAEGIAWLSEKDLGLDEGSADGGSVNFLFEGVSPGTGVFSLVIERVPSLAYGLDQISKNELYMKVLPAGRMIHRARALIGDKYEPADVLDPWNFSDGVNRHSWGYFLDNIPDPDPEETDQRVIHVHGWRMDEAEKRNWSETAFKRLWHQGYKGKFCAFSWPTYGPENSNLGGYLTYNLSEYRAWLSGKSLKLFAASLGDGNKVKIFAHSMGNVAVGSAIREGMQVGGYVMQHAAMSSQAYDPDKNKQTMTRAQGGLLREFSQEVPFTPDTESGETDPFEVNRLLGLDGKFGVRAFGGVRPINYYLERDSALGWWATNQAWNKPAIYNVAGYYAYDTSLVQSGEIDSAHSIHLAYYDNIFDWLFGVGGRPVVDNNEAMGFVTQSLTVPVGATGNAGGSVSANLNLDMNGFGFDDRHSAEWDFRIQTSWIYWLRLCENLQLSKQ